MVTMNPRTGAERYLAQRLNDDAYRGGYDSARERIDQIDRVMRALDHRREELNLSKAELARRAGMPPGSEQYSVRRDTDLWHRAGRH